MKLQYRLKNEVADHVLFSKARASYEIILGVYYHFQFFTIIISLFEKKNRRYFG